jgi:predicted TIM-barrel fold metal-dependent hydrolase
MVIDFHIHYCPEKFVKPFMEPGLEVTTRFSPDGKTQDTLLSLRYDVDKFIEMMDIGGVDAAVLSSGAGMRADLADCQYINDNIKELTEKYPGRFFGVAHVPPLGGESTYQELKRCRDELGFKGVVMHSIVRGTSIDDPVLIPFFKKVAELGMFLIIHPGSAEYTPYYDYDIGRSVCREGHLAETTVRIVESGLLDLIPDLKIVMSHLGGHFYACLDRIVSYENKEFWGTQNHPRHSRKAKHPFPYYLDKIYFDTGGIQGNINPIKMALLEISPKQLLYGTDYPLEIREGYTIRKFVQSIKDLPLPKEDVDGILGTNAMKLLGISTEK